MKKRKWLVVVTPVIALAILMVAAQTLSQTKALDAVESKDSHAGHDHSDHADERGHDDHTGHADHTDDGDHGDHNDHGDNDACSEDGDHGEHADDDAHGDHGDHAEGIKLSGAQLEQMEVETAIAGPGALESHVTLPGEIRLNEDSVAHIVPRIAGVVKEVRAGLGDKVSAGQVLALIESRELSAAKAEYLAALQRLSLAISVLEREKSLFEENISAEAEFLAARQQQAERDIEVTVAVQKLLALGLTRKQITDLPEQSQANLRIYALTAPYDGTIIEKHIVQGEIVNDQNMVYLLADLSTVWVDLNAFQQDTSTLRQGQHVTIYGEGLVPAEATISYVAPRVREDLRTLLVRAVLPNPVNRYRPGLFVNGRVTVDGRVADVVVPAEAVLNVDGKDSVFVQENGGFMASPVEVGRSNGRSVEIVSGLNPGQRYVVQGGFSLKAVKVTSSLEGHAGHGH